MIHGELSVRVALKPGADLERFTAAVEAYLEGHGVASLGVDHIGRVDYCPDDET